MNDTAAVQIVFPLAELGVQCPVEVSSVVVSPPLPCPLALFSASNPHTWDMQEEFAIIHQFHKCRSAALGVNCKDHFIVS